MGRFFDLSKVIDIESYTHEILNVCEDEDILQEFNNRLDKDFFELFLKDYCTDDDLVIIKSLIDPLFEEETKI